MSQVEAVAIRAAQEDMRGFAMLSYNPFTASGTDETPTCDIFHDPIQFNPSPRLDGTGVPPGVVILAVAEVCAVPFSQGTCGSIRDG